MSSLCGCFRGNDRPTQPPVPLDAEIEIPATVSFSRSNTRPGNNKRCIGYSLFGATRYNFDFLTHDNGETFVATFRAMYRREVMGKDSKPIPKDIYKDIRIKSKQKRGDGYGIYIDTGGHDVRQYVVPDLTEEQLEILKHYENKM